MMYHLSLKNLAHNVHMPNRHDRVVKFDHLLHDGRFWAIIALVALLALIISLALLTGPGGEPIRPMMPGFPLYP